MPKETWKPIPDYPLYEASDLGRIRSWNQASGRSKPRIMKTPTHPKTGYSYVCICNKNGTRQFTVHRLILLAFVGPCPDGLQSCHYNGNRTDNRIDNLRWDSRKNNAIDKHRHNTTVMGEKVHTAKLIPSNVLRIRERYATGETLTAIAEDYPVNVQSIHYIVHRKTWKHI